MYQRFQELLDANGTTAYKISQATGISQACLSDWKTGRSTPKVDKLQKLANYFGVSIDYIVNGREEEIDATVERK